MSPQVSHCPSPSSPACLVAHWLDALACEATTEGVHHTWLRAWALRWGADRAALAWWEQGHAKVVAQVQVGLAEITEGHRATGSEFTTAVADALDECMDQGVCLRFPPTPGQAYDWVTHAHQLLQSHGQGTVISVPMSGGHDPLGAVMLRWSADQPPPPDVETQLAEDIRQLAPMLALHRLANRPWHWHVKQALQRAWQQWRHPPNASTRYWRNGLLACSLALMLLPWPDRVGGHARIEGIQQRLLVSPTDGFIKTAHTMPGDKVQAGQVLVDLAEQDLKLERDKWLSQIAQQDNAYAAAMTRGDRAEAAISLSRLEEAQAQLAMVDEQLQRSQLRAPFNGVVIQGDLSQSIGAPVKQGDTLLTVASTEAYRLIMEIDEVDIGRIRIGQTGFLALSALPWHTLGIKVQRITPQAQPRDGRNLYEVQAAFTEALPPNVRPGLMGPAKVQTGWCPPLWSWLRPVFSRTRLWLWAWWG